MEAGEGAEALVGKRVSFTRQGEPGIGGSYAEYCLTKAAQAFPMPEDLSFDEGATHFVNPVTAVGMINRAKDEKATAIIITAAASQLGRMAIRLCQRENITPICTVRKEA